MRLLIVNYEYPPLGGGAAVLTRTLVRTVAQRHDVVVLTSGTDRSVRETLEDGARIVRVPVAGRRALEHSSPLSLASFPPAARVAGFRRLGGWRPDIVHTFFAIPSGPVGTSAARHWHAPHVLTLIGADIHDPSRRFSPDRFRPLGAVVRRTARRADRVTAISTDIARRGASLTGRGDIAVVPCAFDEPAPGSPARERLGWGEDEVVVVSVGRLVARKGFDVLVRAAARLGRNVRIEIIGNGPQRADLQRLIDATGVRVRLAGSVTNDERDTLLRSADVYCQPSLHEGFGIAILEAMSLRLPVVATDAGGPPDFIVDGESGFLVPPANEVALADRLRQLAADASLRARIASAASVRAKQFGAGPMAEAYTRIYEELLHGGTGGWNQTSSGKSTST
jgi:glycosyltransferase involved in cell wall biosynthesis